MMIARRISHGSTAAAVVAAAALFLASCSTSRPVGKGMNPEEALSEVVTLIESAQQIVGGSWKNHDVGALVCALPNGKSGSTQAVTRTGPGVPKDQQSLILERVKSDWTRRGHPPTESQRPVIEGVRLTRLVVEASGPEDAGLFVEFQIADTASTVDARARCVDAEPYEVSGGKNGEEFDGE